MKRSNIILSTLIVGFLAIPLLVLLLLSSDDKSYTGINFNCHVVVIDNPDLQSSDVRIDTTKTSGFPYREAFDINRRTYVYYQGDKQYLPEMTLRNDTLYIGASKEKANTVEKPTLHIHLNELKDVRLNGSGIWTK